ncbi:MAG TPA: methyltransferase domain-containing protein [Blastocatellia bacterium]|nr:methyltransferase domain-containing protein [Blastocatellia bacterium]
MNQELVRQKNFWDEEINNFDSIYSHQKSKFSNFLDRVFRWDMYERFNYTIRNSEPVRGKSFLDVGCGTGRYSLEFARLGAARVVGLDIAERMVEACRRRAAEQKVTDDVTFIQSDLTNYIPDQKFDVAIGIGLFDYIKDALPVVKRMRESVTDRAIMSFPRRWTWRAPVRKARLGLKRCDVYFYSAKEIENLLREAGFARHTVEVVGQLYCVTAFVE